MAWHGGRRIARAWLAHLKVIKKKAHLSGELVVVGEAEE